MDIVTVPLTSYAQKIRAETMVKFVNNPEFLTYKKYMTESNYEYFRIIDGFLKLDIFEDKEMSVNFSQSVRGKTVYLFGSTGTLRDEKILQLSIDAAKNSNAKKIIAVILYFGYARQDKRSNERGCIGARVMARNLMAQGLDAAIIIELHSISIEGFFNIPIDNIYGDMIFFETVRDMLYKKAESAKKREKIPRFLIIPPDHGGTERALRFSRKLIKDFGVDVIFNGITIKHRDNPNKVSWMEIISSEDISGMDVVLIDDMVDTGNTIIKAADLLKIKGARSITAIFVHPVFSKNAVKNLENSSIDTIITSDTIPISTDKIKILEKTELKIVSCTDSISKFMVAMEMGKSATEQFINLKE